MYLEKNFAALERKRERARESEKKVKSACVFVCVYGLCLSVSHLWQSTSTDLEG